MIRYQPYRISKIDNGTESIFQRSECIVKKLIQSMNKKIKKTKNLLCLSKKRKEQMHSAELLK